eukprot:SAG31_NODE_2253_length_6075_cov_2.406459_3_plen_43_part_00
MKLSVANKARLTFMCRHSVAMNVTRESKRLVPTSCQQDSLCN